MKERSIILTGDEVRAIRDGRQTQIRRIVKPQPTWVYGGDLVPVKTQDANPKGAIKCPLGSPGDVLWVREAWRVILGELPFIEYRAGGIEEFEWDTLREKEILASGAIGSPNTIAGVAHDEKVLAGKVPILSELWRSPMHMPRAISRLSLTVKSVRVERVQEISEEDAMAEGMDASRCEAAFDVAAGKHQAFDRCWLEDNESGEPLYWRGGDTFCAPCAEKMHARRHKQYRLCGDCGSAGETDGPAYCDKCGAALLVSLTSYGIERELFLEVNSPEDRKHFAASGRDARIAHTIASGIGDLQEHHLGRLAQIGFATAWDTINGPGAWERNDWVWVVEFEVKK